MAILEWEGRTEKEEIWDKGQLISTSNFNTRNYICFNKNDAFENHFVF